MSIKGKRLLHVGGALFQVPALKYAKENGCYLILVDRDQNVPGRKYADVYECVSTADIEAILGIAKKYHIDGIMTYASDSSTYAVSYVAQKLGLPGNPLNAARILQRKDLFREFQKANGLSHPDFFTTDNRQEAVERITELRFPVVVKPADSAGTKGQSVVHCQDEVPMAFDKAMKFSRCGRVIFENFLKADIMELDGDVLARDCKLAFRHYGHNHFIKNRISNVPSGEIFPGFYGKEVTDQLDEQFKKIISILGLKIGCMNFDGVVSGGIVYILDIGLRNGGNFVPDAIKLSTGFDLTEAAIFGALGQDYPCDNLYCKTPRAVGTYLISSRLSGILEGMELNEEIKGFVKEYRPFYEVGQKVSAYTRSDKAIGMIFLQFPDMDIMQDKMSRIEDLVKLHIEPIKSKEESAEICSEYQVDPNAYKNFSELISPFLRDKIAQAKKQGQETTLRILSRQYLKPREEEGIRSGEGLKHYEAAADAYFEGKKLTGVERLYRRVIIFEALYQCVAHCRYCLRRNYEPFQHTDEDVKRIARYIGKAPGHHELREILVTGGDPFLVPDKIGLFLDCVAEYAPQIEIVRVATRIPVQQPSLVNDKILKVLGRKYPFRIEIPTQVNHAAEIFPEVEEAFRRILDVVRIVYNQTVLVKGVNDTKDELIELFDKLRSIGIENHYVFHCVPIGGLNHLRTPLAASIELIRGVNSSGRISGRAKPKLCLMTSIGKVTPYEGTIIDKKNNRYLLKSDYLYKDRLAWNPHWKLSANVEVSNDGYLCVWYEDAVAFSSGTASPTALLEAH